MLPCCRRRRGAWCRWRDGGRCGCGRAASRVRGIGFDRAMDAYAVPGDVLTVLTAAGLRPDRSLGPTSWLVVPVDGTPDGVGDGAVGADPRDDAGGLLELHVVPVAFDERVVARASALSGVSHPHLPRVRTVVPLGPGRCGLLVEHVRGTSLGRLRAARAPLSDGEAVTLAVPVAGALAALHAAGLAHGAVRADAVLLDREGRPILTDLRGALLGSGSPDDDLRRLIATVLDVLPGSDVELLAGQTSTPTARDELEALLAEVAPSADAVVDRCFAAAEPEPIRLPDAGAVAWAEVSDVADRGGGAGAPVDDGRPGDPRAAPASRRARRAGDVPDRGRRRSKGAGDGRRHPVTAAADGDRARSATSRRRAWAVGVAVLACAAAVGLLVARHATAEPGPIAEDPAAAAVRLTQARAAALAAVDARALTAVDARGGPALATDRALVGRLGTSRLDGVQVSAEATAAGVPQATAAAVTVTSTTSAYVRVAEDGSRTVVPEGAPRTVVLDLRLTPDGWRVWDVRTPG